MRTRLTAAALTLLVALHFAKLFKADIRKYADIVKAARIEPQ